MKKLIPLILLLSGCAQLTTVTMSVKCKELRGKMGNSCEITIPSDATAHIDGETITIDYEGR